ncbi:MAG: ABC-F family ATP-binding cassette domain-containing protein [Lachnospiraceae bacterium]
MNIINIEHISKIFGDKVIFQDASCGIQEGDKIGIIGINGTGKTTFLNILAGKEETDEGSVVRQKGIRLAYLTQHPEYAKEDTVLSFACKDTDESDWQAMSEVKSILNRLGFTDYEEKMEHLSGGQKKKAALARTLAGNFDVLLLDEPTNHLDEAMLQWLEDYLNRFKGTVIMVTHDRYFLDRVSNRILEISHGSIYSYEANYSKFLELKAQREEMELASERKRQSILRIEMEWAKRGCRARTTKQRARLDRLEALKKGSAPVSDGVAELDSVETRMGKKTVELHHVTKGYGEKKLIEDFSYIFLKNQCLGIIGPNGCGKSTLLKLMAGKIQPDAGEVETGETIRMGYFAQDVPDMDSNQRVIDYIRDIAEYVPTRDGKITASQMLERFLFTPDMQYAPVSRLSGGEKKRLHLLSILMQAPNFLALDEVTNDIDIPTMAILEDYLTSFSGIIVAVSHDRYFLDNIADRIFAFDAEGHLRQYEGGYTDYLETKKAREAVKMEVSANADGLAKQGMSSKAGDTVGAATDAQTNASGSTTKDWKQNRPVKLKFTYKEQREYETIDDEIAKLEAKVSALDADILANATNSGKLNELTKEKAQAEQELEEKMDRWVYLNDLAEKIAAQK